MKLIYKKKKKGNKLNVIAVKKNFKKAPAYEMGFRLESMAQGL